MLHIRGIHTGVSARHVIFITTALKKRRRLKVKSFLTVCRFLRKCRFVCVSTSRWCVMICVIKMEPNRLVTVQDLLCNYCIMLLSAMAPTKRRWSLRTMLYKCAVSLEKELKLNAVTHAVKWLYGGISWAFSSWKWGDRYASCHKEILFWGFKGPDPALQNKLLSSVFISCQQKCPLLLFLVATAGTKAPMRWVCLNPIYFSSIVSAPQAGRARGC